MGSGEQGGGDLHTVGLWHESSTLDRADKRLSLPLFTLELGRVFELLLSVPGAWFGVPLAAQMAPPLICAAIIDRSLAVMATLTVCIALMLCLWALILRSSIQSRPLLQCTRIYGISLAYVPLGTKTSGMLAALLTPHAVLLVVSLVGTAAAVRACCMCLTAWLVSVVLNDVLKKVFVRKRPAHIASTTADDAESWMIQNDFKRRLRSTTRHLPQIQSLLARADTSHASFPSGDAAGAAAVTYTIAAISPGLTVICTCVAVVAAFGRVYFQAHHLLDVLVGAGLALVWSARVCAYSEQRIEGGVDSRWTWIRYAVVQFVCVLVSLIAKKLIKSN